MFRKSFEVRWDDVDLNGHLRNTRYLEYASTARVGLLTEAGFDLRALQRKGFAAVLLAEEVRYLREVFLSDQVSVSCQVVGLSVDGSRWRALSTVSRESGEDAAVVHSLGAWLDLHARKIAAPPTELRSVFEAARSDNCEVLS